MHTFGKYLLVGALVLVSTLALENLRENLEKLNLDAQQSASLDQILAEARESGKALRQERRGLYKKMRAIDYSALTEQEVQMLSDEAGRLAAQQMRQKLSTKSAVAKVLTTDQLAQWETIKKTERDARKERWEEHRKHKDESAKLQ